MRLTAIAEPNAPLSEAPARLCDLGTRQPNHVKNAVLQRSIDGDSVWMFIDVDFDDIYARRNCRLMGIDAPDTQPAKALSKAYLDTMIAAGGTFSIYVEKMDKYGRPLVTIYTDLDGPSVNQRMLDAGLAVPYDGGAR
jgi:endonuclease YncB( thermonuclease family)